MAVLARLILSVLLLGQVSHGLFVSDMYPFGQAYSDTKLDTEYDEDISSAEIKLGINVKFFSREYRSIFVSLNIDFLSSRNLYFDFTPSITKEFSREKLSISKSLIFPSNRNLCFDLAK